MGSLQQIGGEVEERSVLIAQLGAGGGTVKTCFDDGVLPCVEVPRAGNSNLDTIGQRKLASRKILHFVAACRSSIAQQRGARFEHLGKIEHPQGEIDEVDPKVDQAAPA